MTFGLDQSLLWWSVEFSSLAETTYSTQKPVSVLEPSHPSLGLNSDHTSARTPELKPDLFSKHTTLFTEVDTAPKMQVCGWTLFNTSLSPTDWTQIYPYTLAALWQSGSTRQMWTLRTTWNMLGPGVNGYKRDWAALHYLPSTAI